MRGDEWLVGFRTGNSFIVKCAAPKREAEWNRQARWGRITQAAGRRVTALFCPAFRLAKAAGHHENLNVFKARHGLVFIVKALDHIVEFGNFDERQYARLQVDDLQAAFHRPQLANAEQNRAEA